MFIKKAIITFMQLKFNKIINLITVLNYLSMFEYVCDLSK